MNESNENESNENVSNENVSNENVSNKDSLDSKICAVVSTFSSSSSSISNIRNIASQVSYTIVVDDSGCPDNNLFVLNALALDSTISLVVNETNLGLAESLNRGIGLALAKGYAWLFTFDDDTEVAPGAVARLFKAVSGRFPEDTATKNIFALSRPGHCRPQIDTQELMAKDVVITTGSLFSAALFRQCGGFDTRLFIDLLDFDFCLRARDLGGQVYQLNSPDLTHQLGTPEHVSVFGIRVFVSNHAPFRHYYRFRNAVAFSGRHFFRHPLFVLKLLAHLMWSSVKMVLFEQEKWLKLRYSARGISDGLLGRFGKIPVTPYASADKKTD